MSSSGEKSVEELKSLVVHTLETNGVLGQIRAQLRANVYKAIDCDEERSGGGGTGLAKLMKSPMGRLMAEIVAEFFVFYEFKHSLSVFLPESNLGRELRSRNEVAFDAGLVRVLPEASILEQLTQLAMSSDLKGGEGWHSSASSTTASSPPPQQPLSASTRAPILDSRAMRSDCSTPPPGPSQGPGPVADGDITANTNDSPVGGNTDDGGIGKPSVSAMDPLPVAMTSLTAEREQLPTIASGSSNDSNTPIGAGAGEEVSLAESADSLSRDSSEVREDKIRFRQIDKRIARLLISGSNGGATEQNGRQEKEEENEAMETEQPSLGSQASAAENISGPADTSVSMAAESSPVSGGDRPRSPSGSRASSAAESPLGSPVQSQGSRGCSASRSASPPSRVASPAASIASSGANEDNALSVGGDDNAKLEESGASVSVEESNGSGSIDLTNSRCVNSGSTVLRRTPTSLTGGGHTIGLGDEGDGDDSVGEDVDVSSAGGSIEAYQDSEGSDNSRGRL